MEASGSNVRYRLYGTPGRASAAPEAVLEELGAVLGVPYEFVELDEQGRKSPDYLRLNPRGLVPTLVDGDTTITEAAAICIHLCDRHPQAGLAPPLDAPTRGPFLQWMFFLSNTLQATYMLWFYPDRYCGDSEGARRVRTSAEARLRELWKLLDDALEPGPYLLGEQLTACDMYMYMLGTWHRESIVPMTSYPRVRRTIDLVDTRPGIIRMMLRNRGH
jgi:glutathione S-transferase